MDPTSRAQLEVLMAQAAAGDLAAVPALFEGFKTDLLKAVWSAARRLRIQLSSDEAHSVAFEAAAVMFDVAPGWRPDGGALPWVWASKRVEALVRATALSGDQTLDVDDRLTSEEPASFISDQDDFMEVFVQLAQHSTELGLLREALAKVASSEDQELFLHLRMQHDAGDPSPSHTVAAMFCLTPATVRQRASRLRRKLVAMAESQQRFAPLRDLALLSNGAPQFPAPVRLAPAVAA